MRNAAKYTSSGGHIDVEANSVGSDVRILVRDSGRGIDPEILPRIFEPFVQGKRGLNRSEGGLGIGLTLVKQIAQLHGGTVEAHSKGLTLGSEFVCGCR